MGVLHEILRFRYRDDIFIKTLNNYLSGVVKTFPDDAIDNDPGQQEKAEKVGLNFSDLLDSATHVENFIAVKLSSLNPGSSNH